MYLEFPGVHTVSTLFGEDTDRALGKAMGIFYGTKHDSSGVSLEDTLAACFKLCRNDTNSADTVARVVAGCHMLSPGLKHPLLLGYANTLLSVDGKIDVPEHFQQGVVLGLFRAVRWMDTHWKGGSGFNKNFPTTIELLVFARLNAPLNDQLRGELANLIKGWVRAEGSYIVGERLAQVTLLIEKIFEKHTACLQKGSDFSLAPIGDYVADQIAYGFLSSTTARDRLLSCTSTFDKVAAAKEFFDGTLGKFRDRFQEVALARAQGQEIPPWK